MARDESSAQRPDLMATSGSTADYARTAIQQCLDRVQSEAAETARSTDVSSDSETERVDAVDALLSMLESFRAWLSPNPYKSVHEPLQRISRLSARTNELESFRKELEAEGFDPIPGLACIRDQVTFRLRRRREKLFHVFKRLSLPSFQDDASRVVATLQWRGDGTEPPPNEAVWRAIGTIGSDLFATVDEDDRSLTTLHMTLQQARQLQYTIRPFASFLPVEPHQRMDRGLLRLRCELEPIVRCSLVIMLSTRWLGETRASQEAASLRLFIPQVEERGRQFHGRLRQLWANGLMDQLRDNYSTLKRSLERTD